MKKDGKYRFSLQFGADDNEQIQAGELLERLGNKKSSIVVAALNEYIATHPELQTENCKVEVKLSSGYDRKTIEKLIRDIINEKLSAIDVKNDISERYENLQDVSEEQIEQMLDNLDIFI